MLLDVLIAIVVLIAVFVGYMRGIVQPLLSEIGFFGTLIFLLLHRDWYSKLVQSLIHTSNVAVLVFIALVVAFGLGYLGGVIGGRIHKMPVVRGVDGFLGIILHALVAVVLLYLVVSALVVLDRTFNPAIQAANLTLRQVQSIENALASNPLTAGLIDSRDLGVLRAATATPGGAHIESIPSIHNLVTFYDDWLQPQLRGSRLAKYVVLVGYRVPIVSHVSPADLAALNPSPSPGPSPSPSPSK